MQIDAGVVREMREEVFQAINAIAVRHGLKVKQQNNVTYTSTEFSVKYTFSDADVDLAQVEWDKKCWMYGFSQKDYGRGFSYEGKKIVICGLSTRAKKYPIKYLADGKPMKCGAEFMKVMLSKAD
jgi:hypothetical protein